MKKLPPRNGPIKQPKPRNKLTIPVALLNLAIPTKSIKYIVVNEFSPALNILI